MTGRSLLDESTKARQKSARRTAWVVGAIALTIFVLSLIQGWHYSS